MADEASHQRQEVSEVVAEGIVRRTYVHLDAPPPVERPYCQSALGAPAAEQRRRNRA